MCHTYCRKADFGATRSIRNYGLEAVNQGCRPAATFACATERSDCQKRSFLSLAEMCPKALKNLVPKTRGEIRFDIVTFLAAARGADIGERCSIQ